MGLFTAVDRFLHSMVNNLGAPAIYAILIVIIALIIAAYKDTFSFAVHFTPHPAS